MNKEVSIVRGKELKKGFTTGSCAAAAASAASKMLLTGDIVSTVDISLPSGEKTSFDVTDCVIKKEYCSCSVIKDAGDDPDVTDGLKIFARAYKGSWDKAEIDLLEDEIKFCLPQNDEDVSSLVRVHIAGGTGVGKVTEKGLQCKVGEPAINPVPRKMIIKNIERIAESEGYSGDISVIIYVPSGAETAKKTFNPKLGIIGGISILGTTGIVDPMSEKALIDTIKVSVDKRFAENKDIVLMSPGNYGKDFCREELNLDIERAVEISNFVGDALDYIKYKGFKKILFVGHTGKLVKLAAGVMNTHSAYADCRMETIACHSGCLGADAGTMRDIMKCITTDKAFDTIKDKPYYEDVKRAILDKAMHHLNFRLKGDVDIEILMFTTTKEHIIKSDGADEYIRLVREDIKTYESSK